jgi:hypothetical protein
VLLTVVLAVLGGAVWGTLTLVARNADDAAATSAGDRVPVPALERIVPPLGEIAMPTPPDVTALAVEVPAAAPVVPAPVAGSPCTDDMIGLEVRGPGTAAAGSKPTFELVVSNVSAVPCVRSLDKNLQEIALLDAAGARVWGSNDCFPEVSSDPRTLAPGEVVSLPLVWSGLTSEPTCTAVRGTPAPGAYALVGRLETKVSASTPLTLG